MPTIKNPCPSGGYKPKLITHRPGGNFCGYGICPICEFNCALTKNGNLMAHRDRR